MLLTGVAIYYGGYLPYIQYKEGILSTHCLFWKEVLGKQDLKTPVMQNVNVARVVLKEIKETNNENMNSLRCRLIVFLVMVS